jgi:hypothetical protein
MCGSRFLFSGAPPHTFQWGIGLRQNDTQGCTTIDHLFVRLATIAPAGQGLFRCFLQSQQSENAPRLGAVSALLTTLAEPNGREAKRHSAQWFFAQLRAGLPGEEEGDGTMSRMFSALMAICLAAVTAPAAQWPDDMFKETSWDFGAVARGPAVMHAFPFKNTTSETLHIGNVRVSCGCTSAQSAKSSVQPGEESAILAQMDTTRFHGNKSVTIYVTFDEPRRSEASLVVRADGRDDVALSPETIDFGQVNRGSPAVASAQITIQDPEMTIRRVRSEGSYVQAHYREINRSGRVVVYEVQAELKPNTPPGQWYTELVVSTNARGTTLRIPVNVDVQPALQVAPRVASLGEVKEGGEVEKRIVIKCARPFKITRVEGTDSQLSVQDASEASKPVHVLTVRLKPSKAGRVIETVRVMTDLKEDSQVEFQATADVTR